MRIFEGSGRLARDPATMQRLPADGLEVPDRDVHWARALADGDVTTTPPAAPRKAAAAVPPPSKTKGQDQ